MKNLVIYSIQEIWHCLDSLKIFGVRLDSFGYTYVNSYKDILACVQTSHIQFCNKRVLLVLQKNYKIIMKV